MLTLRELQCLHIHFTRHVPQMYPPGYRVKLPDMRGLLVHIFHTCRVYAMRALSAQGLL